MKKKINERLSNKKQNSKDLEKVRMLVRMPFKYAMTQEQTTAIFKGNPVKILIKDSALDSVTFMASFSLCFFFSSRLAVSQFPEETKCSSRNMPDKLTTRKLIRAKTMKSTQSFLKYPPLHQAKALSDITQSNVKNHFT